MMDRGKILHGRQKLAMQGVLSTDLCKSLAPINNPNDKIVRLATFICFDGGYYIDKLP